LGESWDTFWIEAQFEFLKLISTSSRCAIKIAKSNLSRICSWSNLRLLLDIRIGEDSIAIQDDGNSNKKLIVQHLSMKFNYSKNDDQLMWTIAQNDTLFFERQSGQHKISMLREIEYDTLLLSTTG